MVRRPIRVLLADGQPVFRRGLRALLDDRRDMVVVAEAGDGVQALRLVGEMQPDVVLLDMDLPGINGLAALELIVHRYPKSRVIIMTRRDRDDIFLAAARAGAVGYLPKTAGEAAVTEAIQMAYTSDTALHAGRLARLVRADRPTEQRLGGGVQPTLPLVDDQEMQLILLLTQGLTNKEIAHALYLTEAQVRHRLSRLYRWLGVSNRTQAVRYAVEKGWVARV